MVHSRFWWACPAHEVEGVDLERSLTHIWTIYRLWQARNIDKLPLIAIVLAGAALPVVVAFVAAIASSRGAQKQ
jgi:hypothetical protein